MQYVFKVYVDIYIRSRWNTIGIHMAEINVIVTFNEKLANIIILTYNNNDNNDSLYFRYFSFRNIHLCFFYKQNN